MIVGGGVVVCDGWWWWVVVVVQCIINIDIIYLRFIFFPNVLLCDRY